MSGRAVRKTGKNSEGDITALCEEGASWSPRAKAHAIADLESRAHTYYVPWKSGRTEIRVVNGPHGQIPPHRQGRHREEQPR